MEVVDIGAVLRHILLNCAEITSIVDNRIWCDQVPPAVMPSMPLPSILITVSGRSYDALLPVLSWTVVFHCYGPEPGFTAAWELANKLYALFARGGTQKIELGTEKIAYYYTSDFIMSGPTMREPITDWPRVDISFEFKLAENYQKG